MILKTHRTLTQAALAGSLGLAMQVPAHASPLSDVFREAVPFHESFNVTVDAFDEALWRATDFREREIWELFVVGQTASDRGHCITHGAFGMHLAYREQADIIAAYHYAGTADYTLQGKARLDFVRAAMGQPSAVREPTAQPWKHTTRTPRSGTCSA